MAPRSLFALGALLVGLTSGHASAQVINSVTSSNDQTVDATVSACVGSVLTIDGTGFGTAKPKVFLTDANNKQYKLKVAAGFTDVLISATITKAVAGDLTLNVQPKGVAVPATTPITIEAPTITELQDPSTQAPITSADANAEFVITGDYFGTKKGKIKIGSKAAKVLSWLDQEIHVVMPKTLANGLWDILLDNKLATDPDEEIITTNSTAKIGKAHLDVVIGTGPGAETIHYKFTASQGGPGYIAFGGSTASFPVKTLAVAVFFDLANSPVPIDIDSADNAAMLISYTKTLAGPSKFVPGPFSNWLILGSAGLVVHITASGGGQCAGTFTADMPSIVDQIGQGPATLHIEGEFIYQAP